MSEEKSNQPAGKFKLSRVDITFLSIGVIATIGVLVFAFWRERLYELPTAKIPMVKVPSPNGHEIYHKAAKAVVTKRTSKAK